MQNPQTRREAIGTLIGAGAAATLFGRSALAAPPLAVPRPAATIRAGGGGMRYYRHDSSVAYAPPPPASANTNQHILVADSSGRPYPGVRVDSRYRAVGTSGWTYYGAQTSQSDGYARFNPFFLPQGTYELNFYTSTASNSLTITI